MSGASRHDQREASLNQDSEFLSLTSHSAVCRDESIEACLLNANQYLPVFYIFHQAWVEFLERNQLGFRNVTQSLNDVGGEVVIKYESRRH
jgi:hypothetical protein